MSIKWKTEQRKIDNLITFEHNPRLLTDKQAKDLTKSLKKFDLAEIPAIDTDNTILAGHMRLKILQQLGRGQEIIDVRVPSRKLTNKEREEYLLRSNKNTGEWDLHELANFDIELLQEVGFTDEQFIFDKNIDINDIGVGFDNFLNQASEYIQISFLFDKTNFEIVQKFIKNKSKEELSLEIVKICQKAEVK